MKERLESTEFFVVYSHNFYSLSYGEFVHDRLNTIKFSDVYLKLFFSVFGIVKVLNFSLCTIVICLK